MSNEVEKFIKVFKATDQDRFGVNSAMSDDRIANRLRHIKNQLLEISYDLRALEYPDAAEKLQAKADYFNGEADWYRVRAKQKRNQNGR